MELTQIETKANNLRATMEKNRDGSYSISIDHLDTEGSRDSTVLSFRTDETTIEEIIEMLTFLKNYNFIQ